MTTWVDATGQERADELEDLSYAQLRCAARRNHLLNGEISEQAPGKGFPNSTCVVERCDCGRWRRRTFANKSKKLLTVAYGGGVIYSGSMTTREIFAYFIGQALQRQGKALRSVK